MRVLITNTGPWGTGSGTVADGVLQELRRRGHKVMAFFPDSGLPGPGYSRYYGHPNLYRIVPFPARYKGVYLYTFPLIIPDPNPRNYPKAWTFKHLSPAERTAYFGYMRKALKKAVGEFSPDVIECQHIWALDHLIGSLGFGYISVAHHSDQMGFRYDRNMRSIARKSARNAHYIISISDYVRQEVIALYGVQPDKVITITNGYNQKVFYPFEVDRRKILSKLGITQRKDLPVITFTGKISRTKGIDILLQANHIIQKKGKALILILGSGGLEQFNKGEQKRFCLENTFFLGQRSHRDLALLHNLARLSVLPSRSEGFGIGALEAMGCAVPIVATRVGGLPSFVVGELVESEKPTSLAEAILKLLQLPKKSYTELCQQALVTAKKYSWDSIVKKRFPYYRELAAFNRRKKISRE
ncbi:MAG: glycosyltransferase family 4 protein [Candidatus Aminicenantes bacterium]|nr:MAG: glycosyltransferase family 4 protein [Candidatus Aminicenantes bacterium]